MPARVKKTIFSFLLLLSLSFPLISSLSPTSAASFPPNCGGFANGTCLNNRSLGDKCPNSNLCCDNPNTQCPVEGKLFGTCRTITATNTTVCDGTLTCVANVCSDTSITLPTLPAIPVHITDTICAALGATNPQVAANRKWYNPDFCTFSQKVRSAPDSEIFGERYTLAQVYWIINSLTMVGVDSILTGISMLQPYPHLIELSSTPTLPNYSLGQFILHLPNTLASRSFSGIGEISRTLSKFSLAPPVYAQAGGYGYTSLSGIQPLWAASRSMAYLLMVIILIAAGFMIMFRVKISPQASISLQYMIPKIIITLIGITFSYAIAGLIIDLTYVVLAFIVFSLSAVHIPAIYNTVLNPTSSIIPHPVTTIGFYTSDKFFLVMLGFLINAITYGLGSGGLSTSTGALPTITSGLAGIIILLLIIIIFVFLALKIFLMLIKSYIMLIFEVILGPWQIMLGLIPNLSMGGLGPWLKGILANASVFVVVPLMLMITQIFWAPSSDIFKIVGALIPGLDITGGVFGIPVTTLPSLPLTSMNGGLFQLAIGFVILALIPKSAEIIQGLFKAGGLGKYGGAIGEALLPAFDRTYGKFAANQARAAQQTAAVEKNAGGGREGQMVAAETRAQSWQQRSANLRKDIEKGA